MRINCECSRETKAQRDSEEYMPNYEFRTWHCPDCGRCSTKVVKYYVKYVDEGGERVPDQVREIISA